MELGLERMRAALELLDPELPLHLPEMSVQVVGTNGKGSTCAFLAALLGAHGLKDGVYSSPHFLDPRERIKLQGEPISEKEFLCSGKTALKIDQHFFVRQKTAEVLGQCSPGLTYFEFLTVLAADFFARAQKNKALDALIWECGLGGRHDATTVLPRKAVIFTPIDLDHQDVLGKELAQIAADKAQALQPGQTALSARQNPIAAGQLLTRAQECGRSLLFPRGVFTSSGTVLQHPELPVISGLNLRLRGPHQLDNALLALEALLFLLQSSDISPNPEQIRIGLNEAFIPGRLQLVQYGPGFILDGAHNPHSLAALANALPSLKIRPQARIFTCMRNKDFPEMLKLLPLLGDGPILVPNLPDFERAFSAEELASAIGRPARAVENLKEALQIVEKNAGPVLICGSLFLLSAFYALLKKEGRNLLGCQECLF